MELDKPGRRMFWIFANTCVDVDLIFFRIDDDDDGSGDLFTPDVDLDSDFSSLLRHACWRQVNELAA
jgi:hypothetical protein